MTKFKAKIFFKSFTIKIVRQYQDRNDIWDNTGTHAQILLKTALVEFLCRLQDEECLLKATELFQKIPHEYFSSPDDPRYNNT